MIAITEFPRRPYGCHSLGLRKMFDVRLRARNSLSSGAASTLSDLPAVLHTMQSKSAATSFRRNATSSRVTRSDCHFDSPDSSIIILSSLRKNAPAYGIGCGP